MNNSIAVVGRGAVGSAIYNDLSSKVDGVELFHSQNIDELKESHQFYNLIIYAAVPGVKWKANQEPDKDKEITDHAFNELKILSKKCAKMILISTIDVMTQSSGAYGKNRMELEKNCLIEFNTQIAIVRLPALMGKTVQKNIWYDLYHPYPDQLNESMVHTLNHYAQAHLNSQLEYYSYDEGNVHYLHHEDFYKDHQLGLYNATHPYTEMLWLDINDLGEILVIDDIIKFGDSVLIASYYKNQPAVLKMYELFEIIHEEKLNLSLSRLEYDKLLNYVDYSRFKDDAIYVNNLKVKRG